MLVRSIIPKVRPIRIAFVGEAPGGEEEASGIPFIGKAGAELNKLCMDSGILRSEAAIMNVFSTRPPGNDINQFCGRKQDIEREAKEDFGWASYTWPPISPGNYVRPYYLLDVLRLHQELAGIRPHLVVTLGNVATWAVCAQTGITKLRGALRESHFLPGLKVLPTIHPAALFRNYGWRVVMLSDFIKAKQEMQYPEIIRKRREIWIEPTYDDMVFFKENFLDPAEYVTFDLETRANEFIYCISLAPTDTLAITIPFMAGRLHYWDFEHEVLAWDLIQEILESPTPKIAQNGLYDIQYLLTMGIRVRNFLHDTMLLHHSRFPGLQKGLGFMGSVYCNEIDWKSIRPRGRKVDKPDE